MAERPYTVAEVASMVRRHPKTILRAIRRGELDAHRIGRAYNVYPDQFKAWLKATRVNQDPMPTDGRMVVIEGGRR